MNNKHYMEGCRVVTIWGKGVVVGVDIDNWVSVKYDNKFDIQTYPMEEFIRIQCYGGDRQC